jgi:hypothetical protein
VSGRRRGLVGAPARLLVVLLRGYQTYVSPAFPPVCRFHPTCSSYAIEALQRHGALRGSWLTLRRLLKCAPWHPGGIDPVPARPDHHEEQARC